MEGDFRVRAAVAVTLREAGFDVLEANGIETALASLHSHKPGLILLDLGMATETAAGVELLARIHEHAEWAGIPVVVLSAVADLLNREVLTRLGVRTIIQKPLRSSEIVTVVRKALAS